jgi:transcriptional regulator with XRE-family HTH domain
MQLSRAILLNIKEMRKKRGLKQIDVARHIGVSTQQYQKYEKGITEIPYERLFVLSEILSVDMYFFFENGKQETSCSLLHLNETQSKYQEKDLLLEELISVFKEVKGEHLRKKILMMAKLIAKEEQSLIEEKYD